METDSKKLGHYDESGFEFSRELLGDRPTGAINFDRLQKHPVYGYIIFEYLLCEEGQTVTPFQSHPNRYWHKNARKFLALWRVRNDLHGILYLVNYAKKGTWAEDQVLLIEVLDMDEKGITKEQSWQFTRDGFRQWFQKLNAECLEEKERLFEDIYMQKSAEELGMICFPAGKYAGHSIAEVCRIDLGYLKYHQTTNFPYAKAVGAYLKKMQL